MSVLAEKNSKTFSQYFIFFAVSFLAFLPTFFIPYVHIDEGNWAGMSQYIFSGQFYQTLSDNKPPFIIQLFWLFSLGGNSMLALHIFSALWAMTGAIIFYKIQVKFLRNWISPAVALWSSLILLILSGVVNYGAFSAELAFTPFVLIAIYFSFQLKDAKRNLALSLFIGILLGAGVNIKPTAAFLGLFPVILAITFSKRKILSFVSIVLGGFMFTALSWLSVQAPIQNIWHEAFQINFQYVKFNNFKSTDALWDVAKNILVVVFFAYPAVVLGAIVSLYLLLKKWRNTPSFFHTHAKPLLLVLSFCFLSFVTVAYGKRFFQQYFVASLPCLVFLSSYSVSRLGDKLRRLITIGAIMSLLAFHSKIFYLQINDKNKNWDSKIEKLVEEVKKDTSPDDTIWISNTPGSAYFEARRKPAVKYYLFLHLNHFVVFCRADESEIKEDLNDPIYKEALQSLEINKPKVIFWTQRESNSCSNRIHISRYPALDSLLSTRYEKVWENELGIYFRRKS